MVTARIGGLLRRQWQVDGGGRARDADRNADRRRPARRGRQQAIEFGDVDVPVADAVDRAEIVAVAQHHEGRPAREAVARRQRARRRPAAAARPESRRAWPACSSGTITARSSVSLQRSGSSAKTTIAAPGCSAQASKRLAIEHRGAGLLRPGAAAAGAAPLSGGVRVEGSFMRGTGSQMRRAAAGSRPTRSAKKASTSAVAAQHRGQRLAAGARPGLLRRRSAPGAPRRGRPAPRCPRAASPTSIMSRRSRWPSASHQAKLPSASTHLQRHADAHQAGSAPLDLVEEARVADAAGLGRGRPAALVGGDRQRRRRSAARRAARCAASAATPQARQLGHARVRPLRRAAPAPAGSGCRRGRRARRAARRSA